MKHKVIQLNGQYYPLELKCHLTAEKLLQ